MAQNLPINAAPRSFPLGAADASQGNGQGQTSAQASKMKELAQQFEGMLLLQMIREMRQSLVSDGADESGTLMSGTGTMSDTMSSAFALQLSQFGGFGLSNALMGSLMQQTAPESVPSSGLTMGTTAALASSGVAPAVATALSGAALPLTTGTLPGGAGSPDVASAIEPAGGPEAAALPDLGEVLDAPVNSPFGWRTDPIDGRTRFHSGVDLRAAYGDEVPVVGAGTVTFAGEQGGYGHTVVVQHADGHQTRYAHLSSIAVRQGDQVQAGQVIGRVGQSGRATGPHLHFEVTDHGKRLDPEMVAARFGYDASRGSEQSSE
jgi:murein DD-endopeptidase MepM/ murein hydrolase activator NlpD